MVNTSSRLTVDLAHKIYGKIPNDRDPPLLVIHGLFDSKADWDSISQRIAQATNKSVIAVDVRNHGKSPNHWSLKYPDIASDISELLNKLSLTKANIIGHSMGGKAAMVLALTEVLFFKV